MNFTPNIAVSRDCMSSLFRMPRARQEKVLEFIRRFTERPDSPGINFEKIRDARDKKLRSVRIDDAYRGIVLHPETGNTYVLLWVDHHDDAYAWARNRSCSVNPYTGSLQIFEVREERTAAEPAVADAPPLFAGVGDRHLLKMGVPEELLPELRALSTEEELQPFAERLPTEVGDYLTLMHLGTPPEEILRHIELERGAAPVADIDSAVRTDEGRSRFLVVENEEELRSVLNSPLELWRVFLHPSQRRLVERDWSGPVRVLGGAGTGKTVAAVHRACRLARALPPGTDDRVLVTTFTVNLASDLAANLARICPDEALERVEVVNLDRWVYRFLSSRGRTPNYLFDEARRKELWEDAISLAPAETGLSESFFRDEWERIVLGQEISSDEEYLRADRRGRGIPLDERRRRSVWRVLARFRELLAEHGLCEPDDAMREARTIIERGERLPYRSIVVDEAQDLGPSAFRLLRAMVPEGPNDLFIAGDAHQRIYRHAVVLSRCGISVAGRSCKLLVNYRTTEETRRWAASLLEGRRLDDLEGGEDDLNGYRSLLRGQEPLLKGFATFDEEADFLASFLREVESGGERLKDVCLVVRSRALLDRYREALADRGVPLTRLEAEGAEDRDEDGVRTATMHRVKGLEFDRMILAGVCEGVVPPKSWREREDPRMLEELETRERSLLHVAATRARTRVVATWHGESSPLLGIVGREE